MNHSLLQKAKKVLNDNHQKGGFTVPSEKLYPFQWKWDSGFIALGFAHYDMAKAKSEIATLLDAQWSNGFIPHIVFHQNSDTYFPGPEFHQAELHPDASKKYRSTGMTQPPVFGFILEKLYQISSDKSDILSFIKKHIDKIYDNHVYFYSNRDLNDDGLVYIYHNWESGTDNSPLWDDIWKTMKSPNYSFTRRDTTHVDPEQRPSKREYDHYLNIIDIAKKYNYDDGKIAKHSPFLVQDPLFNAILIRSNEALITLYELIGGNSAKVAYLKKKNKMSVNSINRKLFDTSLGVYVHYDLRNKKTIRQISSSSFAPLFCGAPSKAMAKQLVETMVEKFGNADTFMCASFDPSSTFFNPKKYWRGPVWINLNWIIYNGLIRYGYHEVAKRIKEDSIKLIENEGFYEYFDPRKIKPENEKSGYGGNNFSWSAALIIDFMS